MPITGTLSHTYIHTYILYTKPMYRMSWLPAANIAKFFTIKVARSLILASNFSSNIFLAGSAPRATSHAQNPNYHGSLLRNGTLSLARKCHTNTAIAPRLLYTTDSQLAHGESRHKSVPQEAPKTSITGPQHKQTFATEAVPHRTVSAEISRSQPLPNPPTQGPLQYNE